MRRRLRFLAGVLALVVMAAMIAGVGCRQAQPEKPKKAQVAGLAIQDEPNSLDPVETIQLTAYQVDNFLLEPLVYIGPDKKPHGWVAESWEVQDGGKVIVFKIRQGRKFHDGTPINAEAVAFTFQRHLDPSNNSAQRAVVGPLEKVEVLDEYTVRFTYSRPFAPVWTNLASPFLGIVSPTAVQKYGKDFGRNLVGSGPFKLEKWIPATGFDLVRFEDYTSPRIDVENKGPVKLERLHIRILPEEGARVAALETGQIHMGDAPREEIERFKSDPNFNVVISERANNLSMIEVNPFKPPTDNIHVRKAIAYAVDIEKIAAAAYAGLATPNWSPLPMGNTGWEKEIGEKYGYRHNPDKVAEHLKQAGYTKSAEGIWVKDGKPLTVVLWTYTLPNGMKGGQVIQDNLKAAGFVVKLETFEVASMIAQLPERKHNLNFMWWSGWDPNFLSLVWKSPGWKKVYSNPELDRILEKADTELDPVKRMEYVREAQKFLLEDVGVIPICTNWDVRLTRAELKGFKVDALNFIVLNDAYIE